jgi:hypothetical protein
VAATGVHGVDLASRCRRTGSAIHRVEDAAYGAIAPFHSPKNAGRRGLEISSLLSVSVFFFLLI